MPRGPCETFWCLAAEIDSPLSRRQFLTLNYPRPNCLLKCLPNCLSPTREDIFSSFKIAHVVRVIARQLSGKHCLAAIFASRHQDASPGPLGGGAVKIAAATAENRRDFEALSHEPCPSLPFLAFFEFLVFPLCEEVLFFEPSSPSFPGIVGVR